MLYILSLTAIVPFVFADDRFAFDYVMCDVDGKKGTIPDGHICMIKTHDGIKELLTIEDSQHKSKMTVTKMNFPPSQSGLRKSIKRLVSQSPSPQYFSLDPPAVTLNDATIAIGKHTMESKNQGKTLKLSLENTNDTMDVNLLRITEMMVSDDGTMGNFTDYGDIRIRRSKRIWMISVISVDDGKSWNALTEKGYIVKEPSKGFIGTFYRMTNSRDVTDDPVIFLGRYEGKTILLSKERMAQEKRRKLSARRPRQLLESHF